MTEDLHTHELRAQSKLVHLIVAAGLPALGSDLVSKFNAYLSLLMRWNSKINLTSVRSGEAILSRHFVESIACAAALPAGIATLLDYGSGAGFPGIPIALCRPEIKVTLSEAHMRKAAFLKEAARVLDLSVRVHDARVETLADTFDCVTIRAVDHMSSAVKLAAMLVRPGGWLVPLTTTAEESAIRSSIGSEFTWNVTIPLPLSEQRVVLIARRRA